MAHERNPLPQQDKAKRQAAALAELMRPVRRSLNVARVLAVASAVMSIFPYVALVQLGDILVRAAAVGHRPEAAPVLNALWLLVGSFAARLVLYFVALMVSHLADVRLSGSLRTRMTDSLGHAPLSWFTENTSGHVRKAMQDDVTALHMLVAHKPVDLTVAIVSPIALGIYAFVIDWRLGLLAIAAIPIYLFMYTFMLRDMGQKMTEFDSRLDRLSASMIEYVSGINVVKAFGTVGKAHTRYANHAAECMDYYEQWARPMARASATALVLISAPVVLLINLAGGYWLVSTGHVPISAVITTSLIALVLPGTIETVGLAAWYYRLAAGAADRMIATMAAPKLPEPTNPLCPTGHDIAFEHVSVRYGETQALTDVSLQLPAGSVTALIGPSGSGKSTLAKLVARFQDPVEGIVRIGGIDVKDLAEQTLYETVSFVLQDAQLIRASVRDNIALARPTASMEQIIQAAQRSRIHDDITALAKGYETVLGEDTALSGGQQQRIAVARALLTDAPVLVLDEATAMTDPETETEIQQALTELARGRTVLVIAHRKSSIAGVDQVAVLEHGRLVALGTPEALADEPYFAALAHTQLMEQDAS